MKRISFIAAIVCAASSMPSTQAAEKCVVPKAWGVLSTAYASPNGNETLIFQDGNGTLRRFNVGGCKGTPKPDWEIARE